MRSAPLLLLLVACGSGPRATPSSLRASDVTEHAALPPGYELGEQLSEKCSGKRGFRALHDERLPDVDCSSERLSRTLRARAAERGSRMLIGKRCRAHGGDLFTVQCSASLAEPSSSVALGPGARKEATPAPAAAQVLDIDEPQPHARKLAPRAYDRVAETAQASVGRRDLGQVSARCESCDDLALRHALRVATGRMGGGEVAAVRCFQDEGPRCVATALEPWSF